MPKLALLSVSDKRGLAEFAAALVRDHGYTLLSTGGTSKMLAAQGLPVREVGSHTGFPEIMGGRVKTLHPKIHGGLLARRDSPQHLAEAERNGIELIDLVAVNLYPFEETVAKPGVEFEEAVENIDIGGPSMLRSAAKNHESVTVVCDPADYGAVLSAMAGDPSGLQALRRRLALKVFQRTAAYDGAIARYLESQEAGPDLGALGGFPATLSRSWALSQPLRYGENPHQKAALYGTFREHFEQLQGKELSYNNILDISSATYLIGEFERPTVAILKHTNPCGVGSAETLSEAWGKAYATDRQAPFGGIIVVNRTLDGELAALIADIFTEVIIAPRFSPEALAALGRKKNLRLMVAREGLGADSLQEIRSVVGGVLVQDRDRALGDPAAFKVVTRRQPTPGEWDVDDVRLEGLQARQVERDRVLPRGADARHRGRPDGARRQLEDRRLEGGRGRPRPQGLGRGERGALPVRRRPRGRGGRGGDSRHPARGIGPRRGGHQGGRREVDRHGVHGDPALQALRAAFWLCSGRVPGVACADVRAT